MTSVAPRTRRAPFLVAAGLALVAVAAFLLLRPSEDDAAVIGTSADHTVELRLDPPHTGVIDVRLTVTDPGGQPVDLDVVTLESVMPSMGHATSGLTTHHRGPGEYDARGELFPMAGVWAVTVRLQDHSTDDVITLTVTVDN